MSGSDAGETVQKARIQAELHRDVYFLQIWTSLDKCENGCSGHGFIVPIAKLDHLCAGRQTRCVDFFACAVAKMDPSQPWTGLENIGQLSAETNRLQAQVGEVRCMQCGQSMRSSRNNARC